MPTLRQGLVRHARLALLVGGLVQPAGGGSGGHPLPFERRRRRLAVGGRARGDLHRECGRRLAQHRIRVCGDRAERARRDGREQQQAGTLQQSGERSGAGTKHDDSSGVRDAPLSACRKIVKSAMHQMVISRCRCRESLDGTVVAAEVDRFLTASARAFSQKEDRMRNREARMGPPAAGCPGRRRGRGPRGRGLRQRRGLVVHDADFDAGLTAGIEPARIDPRIDAAPVELIVGQRSFGEVEGHLQRRVLGHLHAQLDTVGIEARRDDRSLDRRHEHRHRNSRRRLDQVRHGRWPRDQIHRNGLGKLDVGQLQHTGRKRHLERTPDVVTPADHVQLASRRPRVGRGRSQPAAFASRESAPPGIRPGRAASRDATARRACATMGEIPQRDHDRQPRLWDGHGESDRREARDAVAAGGEDVDRVSARGHPRNLRDHAVCARIRRRHRDVENPKRGAGAGGDDRRRLAHEPGPVSDADVPPSHQPRR